MRNFRPLVVAGLGVLAAMPAVAGAAAPARTFSRDNVLGTSFDLTVVGVGRAEAQACEQRILAEIDRLAGILSTYDEGSEIRRVMAGGQVESAELAEVLGAYARFSVETSGAIDVNLGKVKSLWSSPGAAPGWPELEAAFSSPRAYNVDALGKAFIVDRCAELGKRLAPSGLINIGGDARAWGEASFPMRVADPFNFSDNGPGLGTVELRDGAIAASGSYLRGAHLIDPRTLAPASADRAATVIAPTAMAANAWATALCVAGGEISPVGVTGYAVHAPRSAGATSQPAMANAWPEGYQLKIGLTLKVPSDDGRPKRPYVAAWIEDEKGRNVRNLAFWAHEAKYFPEMTAWWKAIRGDAALAGSLVSATRLPGKYAITWDGKDEFGNAVQQGKYRVRLEINREHGEHVRPSIAVVCGAAPATVSLRPTLETEASEITFGPAK